MKNKNIILVVEDDSSIRKLIETALSRLKGFTVKSVETGKEALDFLKMEKPRLVVLDIVMPDMNGYSLLREIKSFAYLKDVPVIISTGKSGLEKYFELEDEEYRPDAFLSKPYRMKDLTDTVKKLI